MIAGSPYYTHNVIIVYSVVRLHDGRAAWRRASGAIQEASAAAVTYNVFWRKRILFFDRRFCDGVTRAPRVPPRVRVQPELAEYTRAHTYTTVVRYAYYTSVRALWPREDVLIPGVGFIERFACARAFWYAKPRAVCPRAYTTRVLDPCNVCMCTTRK